METIKVIQVGVGPIGQKIVQYMLERERIEIVAAVDPATDKAGRDLAELCNIDKKLGITVKPNLTEALKDTKPDVAVLTTLSSFKKCAQQAEEILKHGINIVSTCEEMLCPWLTEPKLAKKLDETAKAANVSVLGTGVNPGFLMDFLPIVMTGV